MVKNISSHSNVFMQIFLSSDKKGEKRVPERGLMQLAEVENMQHQ